VLFNAGYIEQVFLIKPEKNRADLSCRFQQKTLKRTSIPKNEVTEPKTRRLGHSNNELKSF